MYLAGAQGEGIGGMRARRYLASRYCWALWEPVRLRDRFSMHGPVIGKASMTSGHLSRRGALLLTWYEKPEA